MRWGIEFASGLKLTSHWSRQGRKSIETVVWALVVTASMRAVLDLFTVVEAAGEAGSMWWLPVFLLLLTIVPAVICGLRGKLVTAALVTVYQRIALIGAFLLAKPGSWWASFLSGGFPPERSIRSAGSAPTTSADNGIGCGIWSAGHRPTHRRNSGADPGTFVARSALRCPAGSFASLAASNGAG